MQLLKSGILCLALWTLCILLGTGSLSWLLDALSPLAMTICIIYLLQPFVNNLQEFSSLPRSICILLIFLSLVGILLFFLFLLLPRLSDAFSRLLRVDWTALLRHPFLQTLAAYLPLEDWLGRLPQLLGNLLTPLLRLSTSVIQWVGNLFMAFCIAYYALKESRDLGCSLARYILRLLPQKAAALLLNLLDILDQCLSAYLRGRCQISLLLMAAVSLLLFCLSWILRMDLPSPLLFGVIIGLTIVAMGTSAPEASVSINAALAGSNDIAISNVVGSNIFNGLVVVGICAFLHSFMPHGEILKRDMPLNILVTVVLCLMFLDGSLSRIEGAVLLLGMIVYLGFMIYSARKNREECEPGKILSLPRSLLYIAGGLAAVIFGGDLVVDKACIIATNFGVSQNFIGLTIIAIGTSLPELVTSIVATKKGDSGLALGNAIGSNLFNILFILGMSAVISPLHVLGESVIDTVLLLGSAILLFVFARTGRRMTRSEGAACVLLYVAYTAYLFVR